MRCVQGNSVQRINIIAYRFRIPYNCIRSQINISCKSGHDVFQVLKRVFPFVCGLDGIAAFFLHVAHCVHDGHRLRVSRLCFIDRFVALYEVFCCIGILVRLPGQHVVEQRNRGRYNAQQTLAKLCLNAVEIRLQLAHLI